MEVTKADKKVSEKSSIKEWTKFILKLLIVYIIVNNSIGLTKVSGVSMSPTLRDGSLLIVNKLSTHISKPKHGDVIVINLQDKGYSIIKRVIGLPGDTVVIKDGVVYVNNSPLPEIYTDGKSDDMKEVKVEENKIFFLGDNRTPGESLDSRDEDMGTLPMSSIDGYAVVSILPAYKIMKPLKF